MAQLTRVVENERLEVRQLQDFTPTPGTISTAMYYTGLDRDTGQPLFVARGQTERRQQRQALERITLRRRPTSAPNRLAPKKKPPRKGGR
jgi:radical SAM superfamily enzyme YgiQ (UPF0313 family)